MADICAGERGLEPALNALRALYLELEAEIARHRPRCELSGNCCDFGSFGHELFATGLEALFTLRSQAVAVPVEASRCPYWVARRCTARAGRPLSCRVFFCDPAYQEAMQAIGERFHGRVKAIIVQHGLTYRYGRFVDLCRELAAQPSQPLA
ncbi:MAG: hypothetical protein U1E76_03215 [Planctomycetota bacterium]